MFSAGHITNNDEGIKLFEKYGIEYKQMKRSGELRGQLYPRDRYYDFWSEVKHILPEELNDHVDVWQDAAGKPVAVLSPYAGRSALNGLAEEMERRGYLIELSGCFPYVGTEAIVVRRM